MKLTRFLVFLLLLNLIPSLALPNPDKKLLVVVAGANDSLLIARAFRELKKDPRLFKDYTLEFYTDREISSGKLKPAHLAGSEVILANFMKREIRSFLADNLPDPSIKVYSLRSADLTDRLKKKGIVPDTRTEAYYASPTVENIKNMILMVLHDLGEKVEYGKPFEAPPSGIIHPDTREIFTSFDEYMAWYRRSDKYRPDSFWVGIHTFSTSGVGDKAGIEEEILRQLEAEGINVVLVYGTAPYPKALKKYFLDDQGRPRVRILIGFVFRFFGGHWEETQDILQKINAPVFMPLTAHSITIDQWRRSEMGISPGRAAWQVNVPERNGAIEPTVVGGKMPVALKGMTEVVFDNVPIPDQIAYLVRRIKAWRKLQVKQNRDKKIALLYWSHPPGKQNLGASYLNLFGSVAHILETMKNEGYRIDGPAPTEETLRDTLVLGARNVGSWAPGELDNLLAEGNVVRIPLATYQEWFAGLDPDFQENVVRQWGPPGDFEIMTKNGEILIPLIDLGHVILAPQPSRGFGEDMEKFYHDSKIYPHHQYIAFYLWLKKEFKADALISLGKHGTIERLPGKHIGLAANCPPDLLMQDLPNIYPYIVDNLGEGVLAKRRGRGVIIDHLIPPLKKGGAYMELRTLISLIDEYHNALDADASLAGEKLKRVQALIRKMGLDKELKFETLDDEAIEEIEHYVLDLQETLIPYGMHTFGRSPENQALDDLARAIKEAGPELSLEDITARLKASGPQEMASLIKALNGEYIPAGEGNDPVRNPAAIPTGKNFFAFNIDKVPSREAWAVGQKLADDLIKSYREKHGKYPEKLGLVLWSTELQRNEGTNESMAMYLMGVTPVWDKKDKIVDLEIIPAAVLGRPRIDVLIQTSGLYRDSYAKVIRMLDRAVGMAASQTDVENFVAIHNQRIEAALKEKGYGPDDARELSRARIFGPKPGAYSHSLQELAPNSGAWEDDSDLSDVFIHHNSFAYGEKFWGRQLKSAYKGNLKDVNVTLHSRSSNLFSMMDNDDVFAFLGGMSLAVKSQTGTYPDVLVAKNQKAGEAHLETLSKALGKDLRTRYLNPKWIEGMKKEGYAGAREMEQFVEHLWGFQVTTPFAVDKSQWQEVHDVYIEDKYGQDLEEFFDKYNPWAQQSVSARMLEAVRKEYWDAPEETKKSLAKTFALNVIDKGVACCEHTCNNPAFQQYVTNLISLFGLLTPEQMDQFELKLAKATGKTAEERAKQKARSRESLAKVKQEIQKEESVQAKTEGKKIEGFEMVEEKVEETKTTTSGAPWAVMAIVLGILAFLVVGWVRRTV